MVGVQLKINVDLWERMLENLLAKKWSLSNDSNNFKIIYIQNNPIDYYAHLFINPWYKIINWNIR